MANATKKRRLTDRQVAIRSAVERHGAATGLHLWRDFPRLSQSEIVRVCDRLVALGELVADGDPARAYVGGRWYYPAREGIPVLPEEIESMRRYAAETLHLDTWTVGASLRIAVPLSEVERHLVGQNYSALPLLAGGVAGSWDLLREQLSKAVAAGAVSVQIVRQLRLDAEASLVLAVSRPTG